jgi:hypothetical protein
LFVSKKKAPAKAEAQDEATSANYAALVSCVG